MTSVLTKRRDAIAAGLRPWLREEQIVLALEALEDDAVFNLQRFADRIYDRLAPACARRDFHRSLVQSVFLGGGEERAAAAEGDPAETRLFCALLGGFLKLLATQRGHAEEAVRSYIIEKVDRFPLGGAARQALVEWLVGRKGDLAAPLPRDAMRQIVNVSYVLACEYLGPVTADRLLAAAVREAERMPEAALFPPRRLL